MKKELKFFLLSLLFLILAVSPVSAKYKLNLLSRMPTAVIMVDAGSKDIRFTEIFATYEDAKAAVDDWNQNWDGKYADQLKIWEDWRAECTKVMTNADHNTVYKEMGPASSLNDSVYKKVKQSGLANATIVKVTVPPYELPPKPKLEGPYYLAISAINQIAQDGLYQYEWVFLRFAMFDLPNYRKTGLSYAFGEATEKGVQRLIGKGFVESGKHKKVGLEALTGESDQEFDCKITDKGKQYLHDCVNRLWIFRNGMIAEAAARGEITATEQKQLVKDNDYLKAAYNKQIDSPQDWEAADRGYQNMVDMLKLMGAAGDYSKVKEAVKSFEVQDDKKGSTPYGRVLRCIPHLIKAPDVSNPLPLESGTFLWMGGDAYYNLDQYTR